MSVGCTPISMTKIACNRYIDICATHASDRGFGRQDCLSPFLGRSQRPVLPPLQRRASVERQWRIRLRGDVLVPLLAFWLLGQHRRRRSPPNQWPTPRFHALCAPQRILDCVAREGLCQVSSRDPILELLQPIAHFPTR